MAYALTVKTFQGGSRVGEMKHAGESMSHVFHGGKLIYSKEPIPLPETMIRMVEDSTGEWFEFGFRSPELLTGNSAAGWANAGNYVALQIEQSYDLETWNLGRFVPATVPVVTIGENDYEYWSRCTIPRYWKNIIADLTATTTRYGKSITDIKVGGVTVALSYPYAMPAAAATLQADLRAAGYTGAVVSTEAASLSIEGLNHYNAGGTGGYTKAPIDLTFTGGNVTAASYDGSPVTLPSLPYAIPAAAATLQADLRAAGLTGATIRLFDDEWSIFLPDRPAAGLSGREFLVTFTPDDPHPEWDLFGNSLGNVSDNTVTGTFDNVRPGAGQSVIPEASKQFARLSIAQGSRNPSATPPPLSEMDFALVEIHATAVPRQVSGSSSTVTVNDRILNRTVSGSTYQDQSLTVSYSGELPSAVQWSSSNPAVATVDSNGNLTHHATGSCTITATVGASSINRVFNLPVSTATTDVLTGYATGSLAKHASDAVDTRIDGLTPATALALYTTANHAAGTYVRNTGCWAANLAAKLTCISPWNSAGGTWQAGTAISPLHVIFCNHFSTPLPNGTMMRFITAGDVVVERELIASVGHPDYTPYFPDIRIGMLASPLPDTITPCKILPDTWATKLPSIASAATIPALALDRDEKALITDLASLSASASFVRPALLNKDARLGYYEDLIVGDSGNPAFLIINGEMVLLTVWTSGGAGGGTSVQAQRSAINAMMASLGGSHTLQDANLTSFTSY